MYHIGSNISHELHKINSETPCCLKTNKILTYLEDVNLLKYNTKTSRSKRNTLMIAISDAMWTFQLPKTQKMIHLNDVFDNKDLYIWQSSLGLPWSYFGYKTYNDIRKDNDAVTYIKRFWRKIKYEEDIYLPNCCTFDRSHIVKHGETKVRAVWSYPVIVTFAEAVFALPLIEAYQKAKTPLAYGYETAVAGCARIVQEARGKYHYILNFESLDKLVPPWLIQMAFHILSSNLNFFEYHGWGITSRTHSYKMFHKLKNYFINTRAHLYADERFIKTGDAVNDSYFTQLINSILNYILVIWVHLELTDKMPNYIKLLGDESIFSSDYLFDLVDAQELLGIIGVRLNMTKSAVSRNINDLVFLGYQINHSLPFDKWLATLPVSKQCDRCRDDIASRSLNGDLHRLLGVREERSSRRSYATGGLLGPLGRRFNAESRSDSADKEPDENSDSCYDPHSQG